MCRRDNIPSSAALGCVLVPREAREQVGLADARVSDQHDLFTQTTKTEPLFFGIV